MSELSKLCESLAVVDPGFGAAVRPATSEDKDRLVAMIGHDIPGDYDDFLSVMGGYDGGLFYFDRSDTRLSHVLAYCEVQKAAGRRIDTDLWLPIAVGFDFEGFCLITAGNPSPPPVALISNTSPGEITFPSLPAMVFAKAFFHEMCATGKTISARDMRGNTSEMIAGRLYTEGYRREWFSSPRRTYLRSLRNKAMLIMLIADRPTHPTLELGARDATSLSQLTNNIRQMFGDLSLLEFRHKTLPEIREQQRRLGSQ